MDFSSIYNAQEWELLALPREIYGEFECIDMFDSYGHKLNDINKLTIRRTKDYGIEGICEQATLESISGYDEMEAGVAVKTGQIKVKDHVGETTITPCFITKVKESYPSNTSLSKEITVSIKAFDVKWKLNNIEGRTVDRVVEWYINAPTDLFFALLDKGAYEEKINIRIKRGNTSNIEIENSYWHSFSCLQISYNGKGFLLWTPKFVSTEFDWDNKFAIEYRTEFGELPDLEEREAVSELLSFLLGRHLIKVGETYYSGEIRVEACSQHLRTLDVNAECRSNLRQTIGYNDFFEGKNLKTAIEMLLPKYIEKRQEFKLDFALNRFWIAHCMPMGICLPIVSSGLESIMNSWFKSCKSKSQGSYLPKEDYENAINPLLNCLKETLKENPYMERIENKIRSACLMGPNEKFEVFFNEIDLPFGAAERDCIRKRNAFTHGSGGKDDMEIFEKTNAFFILFTRVVLCLLEYEGEYIDYTVIGYPRKNIKEQLGN